MENALQNSNLKQFSLLAKNSDILLALAVVGVLLIMIIPLPTFILDLLLTLNIASSLLILLVGMYVLKPLEFSVFPSILLLVTLFRLSLNIASTRTILLNGQSGVEAAGKVIMAFGNFVVGGNLVVGLIVFLILVVINFVVITKGAGRIAEVAARFTLDAMPGKQMAIDADMNSGLIDEKEAKRRRSEVAMEAEYYGSMDGANKFVRGDAIAGIIITIINILAGLSIGVLQHKMSFGDAAQTYTLLTIGDGLVSQVPALIISTAAGIIVSRAGSDSSLGNDIVKQISFQPRAIALVSAVLVGFGLFPGLPTIPFFVLAIIAGIAAYFNFQIKKKENEDGKKDSMIKESAKESEMLNQPPPVDTLALEVGLGLIPYVDESQGGELLSRIRSIRKQLAKDMGIIVPSVHIQDNLQLKPGEYKIYLKGNELTHGELMLNYVLAMSVDGSSENIKGIKTKEPTYGLPALWIKDADKEEALAKGYTVVNLPTVMATHLSDIFRRYAHEYIGRQEIQSLLDNLKETHPKVVDELVPNLLSLGGVVKVLQNLLTEQIPIRDFPTIMETLADWAPITKDIESLTEKVRQSLSRTITQQYQTGDGNLYVITLGQDVEKILSDSVQITQQGNYMSADPVMVQKIIRALGKSIEKFASLSQQPIVLCTPHLRWHFKKLSEQFVPDLVVLSFTEILKNINIQSLGILDISNAN
ncbi:MAG: flagellar biosynthesis protein FlhA [Desulfobacteraceae bacterium]|nr:flagellar biosynthesis protein FlhA [Desulfobacteraceae bacterium]